MSLAMLLLAVLLLFIGLTWLNFVAISLTVLGWLALISGVLFLLEGLSVWSYKLPARKRAE